MPPRWGVPKPRGRFATCRLCTARCVEGTEFGGSLLESAGVGGTAALVAAYVGFHAEPTIEGTSVATTRAVVNASLLVLMFNFVMSALLFRS